MVILISGVDIDAVCDGEWWQYLRGTALKMATEHGCLQYVKIILNGGANPDLTGEFKKKIFIKV